MSRTLFLVTIKASPRKIPTGQYMNQLYVDEVNQNLAMLRGQKAND